MRAPTVLVLLFALALALPAVGAADVFPAGTGAWRFSIHDVTSAPPGARCDDGEPSIGVDPRSGVVLYQCYATTLRVTFDDATLPPTATWTDVTPATSLFNLDPILATDPVTGRTFAGGLAGPCSLLSFTDDEGATWRQAGNACSAADHPTIGAGPWAGAPLLGASYPSAVYYCAQVTAVQCAVSGDGGATFGPPTPVICGDYIPSVHGSVTVAADGVAYLPFRLCWGLHEVFISPRLGVSVTLDNGLTWQSRPIVGSSTPDRGFDPDVATTPSGWVYMGYPNATGEARVSLSKDHGLTWTTSPDLGAAFGLRATTFHEMVAGDDDRAAVAFLGTTTPGDAFENGFTGTWHLYLATTLDAGATWTTLRVTDDPVQRGCIWDGGGSNVCRNLLDFMDAQVDPDGRIVIGYADGCVGGCVTNPAWGQSTSARSTIARQACGPSLYAAAGNVEGTRSCA